MCARSEPVRSARTGRAGPPQGQSPRLEGRFKRLSAAGLPEIDLHDVRRSYAAAGRNAKIDWKVLSQRIGHADVAFTMRQYVQPAWRPTTGSRTRWLS